MTTPRRLTRWALISLGALLVIYLVQVIVRATMFNPGGPSALGELLLFITWLLTIASLLAAACLLIAAAVVKFVDKT